MLNLNETGAFNKNFDTLGFQSMYFLNNLGPLVFAFLFYFIAIGVLYWINKCSAKSQRAARWSDALYDSLFYNSITSIMMESYSLMGICIVINLQYIRWGTWGEVVQTVICFCSLAVLILFPFIMLWYSRKSWEQQSDVRKRVKPFFEELDVKKGPIVLVHPLYFLVRRFLMSVMVVYMR